MREPALTERPWVHPSVEVGPSPIHGHGLFASVPLDAGVVVVRLAGRVVGTEELMALIAAADGDDALPYVDTVTIDEGRHLVLPPRSPVHHGNHSCDPTMWHVDAFTIASRRAVLARDELTVDYATQSGLPGWSMTCGCAAEQCRGVVTGRDWQRSDLQARYAGHWMPVLADRIAALTDLG